MQMITCEHDLLEYFEDLSEQAQRFIGRVIISIVVFGIQLGSWSNPRASLCNISPLLAIFPTLRLAVGNEGLAKVCPSAQHSHMSISCYSCTKRSNIRNSMKTRRQSNNNPTRFPQAMLVQLRVHLDLATRKTKSSQPL